MAEEHDKHNEAHGDAAHGKDGHGGGHKKKHHHGGHGAHEEHEEGWIVSFADNVLLMMGFFVILLAMNMGPKATGPETEGDPGSPAASAADDHMLDFAIAVREAFHNPVAIDSDRPEDQPLVRRLKQRSQMGETTKPGPDGDKKDVQSVRPDDWSGRAGYVEFGDHASDLTQTARTIISEMSKQIVGTRWIVEVRGHASKLEGWGDVKKARRLSYDRAMAAAAELVLQGVRWEQIRIVSSGDHAPVTPRARTASEHMTNQRAEILIMRETMPEDPYTQPSGEH